MLSRNQCLQKEIRAERYVSKRIFQNTERYASCVHPQRDKTKASGRRFFIETLLMGILSGKRSFESVAVNPQETIAPLPFPSKAIAPLRIASAPKTGKLICMPSNVIAASKRNILAIHMHIRGPATLSRFAN